MRKHTKSTAQTTNTKYVVFQSLYEALENPRSRWFSHANDTLAFLTLLSVTSLAFQSVAAFASYDYLFMTIEYVAVFFFTIEYVVRFAAQKTRYAFSFFGIIDFFAILPTFFMLGNLTFLKTTRILRILRFLRIIRLTKLARITTHPTTRSEERLRVENLNLKIYFLALTSAIVMFGAFMYLIEGYRAEFSNMFLGMVWAVEVILGGINHVAPETLIGEITAIAARFVGLVLFGLLITVVGGFMQKLLFGSATREQGM